MVCVWGGWGGGGAVVLSTKEEASWVRISYGTVVI